MLNEAYSMNPQIVSETLDIETGTQLRRPGDTLGYARVSTPDQCLAAQRIRLLEAGAIRVFTDVASGKRCGSARPRRTHRSRPTRRPPVRHPPRPPGTLTEGIARNR